MLIYDVESFDYERWELLGCWQCVSTWARGHTKGMALYKDPMGCMHRVQRVSYKSNKYYVKRELRKSEYYNYSAK